MYCLVLHCRPSLHGSDARCCAISSKGCALMTRMISFHSTGTLATSSQGCCCACVRACVRACVCARVRVCACVCCSYCPNPQAPHPIFRYAQGQPSSSSNVSPSLAFLYTCVCVSDGSGGRKVPGNGWFARMMMTTTTMTLLLLQRLVAGRGQQAPASQCRLVLLLSSQRHGTRQSR